MDETRLYFIPQASHAAFRDVASTLEWEPLNELPDGVSDAWVPQGAEARVEWREGAGDAGPLLVISGSDAEFVAADLQHAVPLVDAEDAMNAIAQAQSVQDLERWAERIGVFAQGERDPALESVIVGLLDSGNLGFQRAALSGLRQARWPHLAGHIASQRLAGVLPSDLHELASEVEHLLKAR